MLTPYVLQEMCRLRMPWRKQMLRLWHPVPSAGEVLLALLTGVGWAEL